jgi:hypothetical protein
MSPLCNVVLCTKRSENFSCPVLGKKKLGNHPNSYLTRLLCGESYPIDIIAFIKLLMQTTMLNA